MLGRIWPWSEIARLRAMAAAALAERDMAMLKERSLMNALEVLVSLRPHAHIRPRLARIVEGAKAGFYSRVSAVVTEAPKCDLITATNDAVGTGKE